MKLLLPRSGLPWLLAALSIFASHQAVCGKELAISCPVQRTTQSPLVPSSSLQLGPTFSETLTVSYLWQKVADTPIYVPCSSKQTPIAEELQGMCLPELSLEGNVTVKLCYDEAALYLHAFGKQTLVELPEGIQVTTCSNSSFPLAVSWTTDDQVVGQIVFSERGCGAAWGQQLDWWKGSREGEQNPSPAYAAAAGFPVEALIDGAFVSSFSVENEPSLCSNPAEGYSNGLTTQLYASQYTAGETDLSLTFSAPANETRCDCPNHQASGAPWTTTPPLSESLANNFGASLAGEFLTVNATDVDEDLAAWKLVCLQYNDAVRLVIDGKIIFTTTTATTFSAGYQESCKALQIDEGWHKITLAYGNAAEDPMSTLRFFVLDAVGGGANATDSSLENDADSIQWDCDAHLCSGANTLDNTTQCCTPYDCCNFRTAYGCGASPLADAPLPSLLSPPPPSQAAASAPVQYKLPKLDPATIMPGGGAPGISLPASMLFPPSPTTPSAAKTPPPDQGASAVLPADAASPAAAPVQVQLPPAGAIIPPSQPPPNAPVQYSLPPSASLPPGLTPLGYSLAPAIGNYLAGYGTSAAGGSYGAYPAAAPVQYTLPPVSPAVAPSQPPTLLPVQYSLPPVADSPPAPQPMAPAPVQYDLPGPPAVPAGTVPCALSTAPCSLARPEQLLQTQLMQLQCNASGATAFTYSVQISYAGPGNASEWLAITPSTGFASSNAPVTIMLMINSTDLAPGEYVATLNATQQSDSANLTSATQEILLVVTGDAKAQFNDVALDNSGNAAVAVSLALGFQPNQTAITVNATLSTEDDTKFYFFSSSPFAGAKRQSQFIINDTLASMSPYQSLNSDIFFEATYEIALPLAEYSSATCGSISTQTSTTIASQPQCEFFAVDMAFCGKAGLVTSQTQAQVVLACTSPVSLCSSCITISGPRQSTAQLLSYASNATSAAAHHILLRWPPSYSGPVTVDVQDQRYLPGCGLDVTQENTTLPTATVPPLQFSIQEAVPVRSAAYQLLRNCEGSDCTFNL